MVTEEDSLVISPDELKSLYLKNDDFVVIDVREPEEFHDWKIHGSTNVPLGDNFVPRVREVAQDGRVITVCRTGVRSLYAVRELEEAGLNAKSLRGGMVAWSNTYLSSEMEIPGAPGSKLIQIRRLSKGCTSYILGHGNDCMVVDPSSRIEEHLSLANSNGFKITHVIDTHKHADHISGARPLASAAGAELLLCPKDHYYFEYGELVDGENIRSGDGHIDIRLLHTPGHTPGSTSLLVNDSMLLSGDTLFLDGMGRPDLQGSTEESAKQLYKTCQTIFEKLDSDTVVLPAHFGSCTDLMGKEPVSAPISMVKAHVERVDLSDVNAVEGLVRNLPKPANYESILRINSGQDHYDPSIADLLEEGHNRCAFSFGAS